PLVTDYTRWNCKPSEQHPYPVILLHGLIAPSFKSWAYLAKTLSENGYCVFQLKYGMIPNLNNVGGLTDMRKSAKELAVYVDKVLEATGASKVDLIGHSEGTAVTKWYVRFEENAVEKTRSVVSVAPVGRGTNLQGLLGLSKLFGFYDPLKDKVESFCPACTQLLEGSDFMLQLYADDIETLPGIRYLNIVTRNDQIVTPFTRGLITKAAQKFRHAIHKIEDTVNQHLSGQHPLAQEEDHDENDPPRELHMSSDDIQNIIFEEYCCTDILHANHFALFRAPFTFSAVDAFLGPWDQSSTSKQLKCT
ncbi:hypothetical protein BGZ94_004827, partial [Podila epigama]